MKPWVAFDFFKIFNRDGNNKGANMKSKTSTPHIRTKESGDRIKKDPEKSAALNRRKFLSRILAGAAASGLAMVTGSARATDSVRDASDRASPLDGPQIFSEGNQLERMRKELLDALKKPVSARKWIMVIDQQKCIGCYACNMSCNAENNLPPGVLYRPVPKEEVGEFPHVRMIFTPRPCMHCNNPPCTPVCPVKATWKREDGIVVVDYDVCIGCRNCIAACPYNSRTSDFGEFYGHKTPETMLYETRPNFEYGKEWKRWPKKHASPMGNARKCHFCLHRIREGMLPACVTTCLGGATYFGDYGDKKSMVHELIASGRVHRLKESLGTDPSVYYLA